MNGGAELMMRTRGVWMISGHKKINKHTIKSLLFVDGDLLALCSAAFLQKVTCAHCVCVRSYSRLSLA